MNLVLKRTEFKDDGVFGELLNGYVQVAATLEHSYGDKPKIPAGFYTCVRGMHELEGMSEPFETFEITGVVGHTKLLFHSGNSNADSAGCVLLGKFRMGDIVAHSRVAFKDFMALQEGLNAFVLQVCDA